MDLQNEEIAKHLNSYGANMPRNGYHQGRVFPLTEAYEFAENCGNARVACLASLIRVRGEMTDSNIDTNALNLYTLVIASDSVLSGERGNLTL